MCRRRGRRICLRRGACEEGLWWCVLTFVMPNNLNRLMACCILCIKCLSLQFCLLSFSLICPVLLGLYERIGYFKSIRPSTPERTTSRHPTRDTMMCFFSLPLW